MLQALPPRPQGGVMVPMNPLLKPEQAGYIARDCAVQVLVTSPERLAALLPELHACPALRHLVLTGPVPAGLMLPPGLPVWRWVDLLSEGTNHPRAGHGAPLGWIDTTRAHPAQSITRISTRYWSSSPNPFCPGYE